MIDIRTPAAEGRDSRFMQICGAMKAQPRGVDVGPQVFIRSAAKTHTKHLPPTPKDVRSWLHGGTRVGGSDRRRVVLLGTHTTQVGFGGGIRMAFAVVPVPEFFVLGS